MTEDLDARIDALHGPGAAAALDAAYADGSLFGEPRHAAFDEAVAQLADPDRYAALMRLTYDQRHPCPIDDCRLSAEEHHRLAFGMIAELKSLRRRVVELENGATS